MAVTTGLVLAALLRSLDSLGRTLRGLASPRSSAAGSRRSRSSSRARCSARSRPPRSGSSLYAAALLVVAAGGPARGVALRPGAPMRLVAVVLNWNGGEDTPRALASLEGIETICVDNGSTDGSDDAVERDFPAVELIRTGENLGFAGGNNVGIRRALERGADWVLLINNDAVAVPGIAEALERAAAARPRRRRARLQGDVRERRDGDVRRGEVPRAGSATRAGVTGHGGPDTFHLLRDTGRADGAAMAVSRAAIERAGLLDERLFLYVEDVDWSLRISAAGFAVVFVPDAVVLHQGSASSGGSASTANLYYSTRNTIFVSERARPLPRGFRGAAAWRRRRGAPRAGAVASRPARRGGGRDRGLARRPRRPRRSEQLAVDVLVGAGRRLPREEPRPLEPARRPLAPARASTSSTAAAIAAASFGSKSRAASPTTSGSDATSEHATGQPHAIASTGGWPKPSYSDGKTSAAARR